MEHYKAVIMEYLECDKGVFLNRECFLELEETIVPEKTRRHCSCDAVAIDLRHGTVYLCDSAWKEKLQSLIRKLSIWTADWDAIKAALRRVYKVPASWRVHVWLFVPRESIELLDERLEQLRQTVGPRFKVKVTALEDVQPWRISGWKRSEEAWETTEEKLLI